MLLTTTSSLAGVEIEEHLGIVHAHEALGTGLVTDLAAGIADVFGLRGSGYERTVQMGTRYVLDALERAACSRGANAVIAIRVDHELVSTSNSVLVSAMGTAVRVRRSRDEPVPRVSPERMALEVRRMALLRAAHAGQLRFDDDELAVMRWTRAAELLPYVICEIGTPRAGVGAMVSPALPAQPGQATAYLQSLPAALVSEHLHAAVAAAPLERVRPLVEMVHFLRLVDLRGCAAMLASERLELRKRALALLLGDAPSYSPSDATTLEELMLSISGAFPERGTRVDERRWRCPCGGDNKAEYCRSCWLDLRGFREDEPRPEPVAQLVRDRLSVLRNSLPCPAPIGSSPAALRPAEPPLDAP